MLSGLCHPSTVRLWFRVKGTTSKYEESLQVHETHISGQEMRAVFGKVLDCE